MTQSSPSSDTAGVETILVRLDASQAEQLPVLWEHIDEQAISADLRIALDQNGMRAGKITANLPFLLDHWIRQTFQRIEEDPIEQAGYAADISSYSQLWRCHENAKKELSIRRLFEGKTLVEIHGGTHQTEYLDNPYFRFSLEAVPQRDSTARVRLVPEIEYGDLVKKVNPREAAIRMDSAKEAIVCNHLAVDLRIQRGDYIVIGPTNDSRGLGKHFFHTVLQNGEVQPFLLVVRLSESNRDDFFKPPNKSLARQP